MIMWPLIWLKRTQMKEQLLDKEKETKLMDLWGWCPMHDNTQHQVVSYCHCIHFT